MSKIILYEVIPVRIFLIVTLVFYHAFAIYSGAWAPIDGYPSIPVYNIMDKLSYAALLETFVFISGYILGFQLRNKGRKAVLNAKNMVQKKVKRLIIPSIIFSILYVICFNNPNDTITEIVYKILCGAGHMWFLPMLFWCFIIVYCLELLRLKPKYCFALIFVGFFLSAFNFPLGLNKSLYYLLFFYTGYFIQKTNFHCSMKLEIVMPVSFVLFIITFIIKLYIREYSCFICEWGG